MELNFIQGTEYTVIMSTEDESSITEPYKNGKTDKYYYKIPNCYAWQKKDRP